jgi:serine/threonine-protein kinase HipA
VARYDRVRRADGETVRVHQEDFCQALGRPPERKYQQEGGPLVRECVALLREWSSTPVLDIREFVDVLIFNLLIGNADAHGKNYSMIYRHGERRLAPFYDIVSTVAWPELWTRLAMNIGKGRDVNDVNPDHFRRMTEEAALGWPMVRERIASLSGKVIETLDAGEAAQTSPDPEKAAHVSELAAQRCRRMMSRLSTKR